MATDESALLGLEGALKSPAVDDRVAHDRSQPGYWKEDLTIGSGGQSSTGTLGERANRKTKLVRLSGDRTAATVTPAGDHQVLADGPCAHAPIAYLGPGHREGKHDLISHAFGILIHFCDLASPWQQATNEDASGLVRQYFPKGTDLSACASADFCRVECEINSRPRQTLEARTADEESNGLTATLGPHRCDNHKDSLLAGG